MDTNRHAPRFDHSLSAQSSELDALCEEYLRVIKDHLQLNRFDKKHALNLRALLTNLLNAEIHHDGWISIDKNRNLYKPRYIDCSYQLLIQNIVNSLIEMGQIEQELGVRGEKTTEIRAVGSLAQKLLALADVDIEQDLRVLETIILKDTDKVIRDYQDTDQTRQWRANLLEINEAIQGVWVDIFVTDEEFKYLRKKNKDVNEEAGEDAEEASLPVSLSNKSLKRVFNNSSWGEGGRFYGGWWQQVTERYRPFITINHSLTIECDYSSLSAEMIYAQAGAARPEGDLYEIDALGNYKIRKKSKLAFQIMLNTRSRWHAVEALKKSEALNDVEVLEEDLIDHLLRKHSAIKDRFFRQLGPQLQKHDSELAEEIMLRALRERGILLLPIHDSFIADHSLIEYLPDLMAEVFEEKMGKKCNTDFNLKFEYNPFRVPDNEIERQKRSRYFRNKARWEIKKFGYTETPNTFPSNDHWPVEIEDDDIDEF